MVVVNCRPEFTGVWPWLDRTLLGWGCSSGCNRLVGDLAGRLAVDCSWTDGQGLCIAYCTARVHKIAIRMINQNRIVGLLTVLVCPQGACTSSLCDSGLLRTPRSRSE